MQKEDCPFCSFSESQVEVYRDDLCFAIISRDPINKYHVIVIPKEHYTNFIDIPDELAAHIFLVTKKLSAAVRKCGPVVAVEHHSDDDIAQTGINLVAHYKMHIIPRYADDRIVHDWNRKGDSGTETRAGFAKEVLNHL